ncbi:MAG: hypothetical protein AYP45_05385 [Candidatus Brocadia carolinensis]|uniref:Uncharacterized protein n=1 Tax=Candidatus Brocadia carolinensis TaxID=1004156 RepID=A0A1V4AVH2_9BACT|nr:MAG: hypothetical protein AYP45_05385 [Candidatus Brocadia caroliniensis]
MKVKHIPYQMTIVITLGVYLYYLIYRVRYTINPESLILSLSFFLCRGAWVYCTVSLFLSNLAAGRAKGTPANPWIIS